MDSECLENDHGLDPALRSLEYSQLQSPLFGKLPPELRTQIYHDALDGTHLVQHIFHGEERARLRLKWGGPYLGDGRDRDNNARFRHEPCDLLYHPGSGMDKVAHQRDGGHWNSKPTCIFSVLLFTCKRM
jgi:hypothetical protein